MDLPGMSKKRVLMGLEGYMFPLSGNVSICFWPGETLAGRMARKNVITPYTDRALPLGKQLRDSSYHFTPPGKLNTCF